METNEERFPQIDENQATEDEQTQGDEMVVLFSMYPNEYQTQNGQHSLKLWIESAAQNVVIIWSYPRDYPSKNPPSLRLEASFLTNAISLTFWKLNLKLINSF